MAASGGQDEEAAILARIKALSGAIEQRKAGGTGASSASARRQEQGEGSLQGGYGYGGAYGYNGRGRGAHSFRSRGRGHGRGYNHAAAASSHTGPHASRHRTLVLSAPGVSGPSKAEEASGQSSVLENGMEDAKDSEGWVKRKSTHNMSLVSSTTFQKTEPARVAAMAATQSARQAAKTKASTSASASKASRGKGNASIRRGDNMGEVIIDGVTFEFDKSGTKLVKKHESVPVNKDEESVARNSIDAKDGKAEESPSSTPLKTSVNGQSFVRTKTGNLISKEILDRRKENKINAAKLKRLGAIGNEIAARQKLRNASRIANKQAKNQARGLCAFFNKTGQCKNGLSCPFKHDPARLAICPHSLRPNGCTLPAGTCSLSHDRRPERVPHCVHYLATDGHCRNGDDCLYTHPSDEVAAKLTNESPVCMEFSNFGWCARGNSCPMRHTWDCPDFLRKGKCERRGCKLMHVVRISNVEQQRQESENRALQDDDLFLRDDEAAGGHVDERDVASTTSQKRKRDLSGREDENDNGGETFEGRKRKSRAFAQQNDFISFEEEEENEEAREDEEDEEEEVPEAGDGSGAEEADSPSSSASSAAESVSSAEEDDDEDVEE